MIVKKYENLYTNLVDYLSFKDSEVYNIDSIKTVTLQVTNKCNLACTYCYQHNKNNCMLSFDTAKKFIDGLLANEYKEFLDIDKVNFLIFDFIGGEPFIAIDLMDKISDYIELKLAKEYPRFVDNHVYSISTNGTLYFDDRVQKYLDKYQGRVSVSVTVDGNKDVHDACRIYADDGRGSYDDAHAAAISVKERYGEKGTKITLAPGNIKHLAESFKYFYGEGYTTIHMNCVYENVWDNLDDTRLLYAQVKDIANWLIDNNISVVCSFFDNNFTNIDEETSNWCGGTGSMISISPEGNIYPCQRYAEISIPTESQEPYKLGDVTDGFLTSDKEVNLLKQLNNITAWSCSDEECRACPIASSCGYCSAFNYEVYGTVNKRTKFTCTTHKARYLVSYYYYWTAKLKKADISWVSVEMDCKLRLSDTEISELLGDSELKVLKELETKALDFNKSADKATD